MGELNKRVNKFAADLDSDFDALLRVVRAAEKVGAIPLQTRHQDNSDRAVIELREALEALPEHLR